MEKHSCSEIQYEGYTLEFRMQTYTSRLSCNLKFSNTRHIRFYPTIICYSSSYSSRTVESGTEPFRKQMLRALLLVDGEILLLMARSYSFSGQKYHILLLFQPKHLISSGCGDGIKLMLYFPIQFSQSAMKAMGHRESTTAVTRKLMLETILDVG